MTGRTQGDRRYKEVRGGTGGVQGRYRGGAKGEGYRERGTWVQGQRLKVQGQRSKVKGKKW